MIHQTVVMKGETIHEDQNCSFVQGCKRALFVRESICVGKKKTQAATPGTALSLRLIPSTLRQLTPKQQHNMHILVCDELSL